RHCAVFSGHARLALAYDSERLSAAISRHELSAAWLSVNGLVERLKSAIENHQPLSFVRLGDGEARFLAYVTPSIREQLSPEEAESIIDIIWHNWFGHPIKQDHSENINEVRELFQNALQSADILGVTTSDRYVKDTFHRGYLNVLQSLIGTVIDECPGMALTNALIPMELHRHSPFFSDILSGLDFVGVISPHPGLAGRLARYHGITKSREYIIPGETRLPEAIRHLTGEAHLPDVFRKLLRNICVPYRGAVFLVAAGLLGKIYCARIRNLGGVAIDVGSIVDAWMGQNTRPGQYDKTEEWILPDAPQIMGFTEYKPDSA
ncbi:MAG TPA: hypothetical protein VHE81_22030, partial [Lacipirellulaceae bacterium]|nr:hypothetical protein [Lacipirellulaceae bacterium]